MQREQPIKVFIHTNAILIYTLQELIQVGSIILHEVCYVYFSLSKRDLIVWTRSASTTNYTPSTKKGSVELPTFLFGLLFLLSFLTDVVLLFQHPITFVFICQDFNLIQRSNIQD